MFKLTNKNIALTAVIAGLYVVLSIAVLPLSSGAIQIRISEGLTVLPLLFPEAVLGVTVGCLLSNIICGLSVFDIVFGSIVTFMASCFTYVVGRRFQGKKYVFISGAVFPVVLNAFLLPMIWFFAYGMLEYLYILQVLFLLVGESVSVFGIGYLMYKGADKYLELKGTPINGDKGDEENEKN